MGFTLIFWFVEQQFGWWAALLSSPTTLCPSLCSWELADLALGKSTSLNWGGTDLQSLLSISYFCWYRLHLPAYYFCHDVVEYVHGSTVSKKKCALKDTHLPLLLVIQKIGGYPKHMAVQHVIRYICTCSYSIIFYNFVGDMFNWIFICKNLTTSDYTRTQKYTLAFNHLAPSVYLV
jgi:hypothetical protein